MPRLDIAIATLGMRGIERLAGASLPRIDGVRYVISWQIDASGPCVPQQLRREDIEVHSIGGRGLSANRNNAFAHCTAPLVLIADDDLTFLPRGITAAIEAMEKNPRDSFALFRYTGDDPVHFPAHEEPLPPLPRCFPAVSFIIMVRREVIDSGCRFDTRFGIGAELPVGEDDLFLLTMFRKGFRGHYYPITIVHHNGLTTGHRSIADRRTAVGTGAVIGFAYPLTAPLRIPLKAWRMSRRGQMPFGAALNALTQGWFNRMKMTPPWNL